MSRIFLTHIDLKGNQLYNAIIGNASSSSGLSSVTGSIYYDTTLNKLQVREQGSWVGYYTTSTTLNNITAPTGSLSLNSQKITNLLDPTSAQDAATKAYVDNAVAGIDWKASVRVATIATGTLSTAYANGQSVDGVTLATGDRILIKNQSTGSENGIYVVAASGAPTRSTDADTGAEITASFAVFVEEGTTNADSGWVLTNNGAITVGTTVLTFTQFTGLGSVTVSSPLSKSGNTISIAAGYGDTQNPYGTKTQKTFLAAPNGADGVPSFRAVLASDIPTLNQNTTGSAGSVTNALTFGTGLTSTGTYNGSTARTVSLASAFGDTTNPYGTKTPNFVLAGPASGSTPAVPAFRALVDLDIPGIARPNAVGTNGAVVNVWAGNTSYTGGIGGVLSLRGGDSTSTTGFGGNVNITGGNTPGNSTAGVGGPITIQGGQGANGGEVQVNGGEGVAFDGGQVTLRGGNTAVSAKTGGAVSINAGNATSTTSGSGGGITIQAGDATSAATVGTGGHVLMFAGSADTLGSTSIGGDIIIGAGNAWTNGGNVFIDAGSGDTADGSISVGAGTAVGVTLGNSLALTTVNGGFKLANFSNGILKVVSGTVTSATNVVSKYAANSPSITPVTLLATWSIPQSTHLLGTNNKDLIVQMYQTSDMSMLEVDVAIATSGDVTLTWNTANNTAITAGTYRVVIIG